MGKKKGKKKPSAAARAGPAAAENAAPSAPLDPKTLEEARELQAQELEVLEAIFDRDLVQQSATPLYSYIFSIRLRCESPDDSKKKMTAEVLLHFDFARGYPLKVPVNLAVEALHGLSDADRQKLTFEMEKLAREKVGEVMVYDLVVCATDFIQEHLKDQSSFFEQMLQNQQDRETQERQVQDELQQREDELARAKNEEILALIDAERKKKRDKIKKRNVRRRRHRSSIDGEEDYGSDEGTYSRAGESESLSSLYEEPSNEGDGSDSDSSAFSDSSSDSGPLNPDQLHSRYHSDFKEIGLLGRGGGGEVVKVRNRLDRQLYAVKKIKLDPDDPTMKKKILREVKTISRMQHRHIVRYFQAWIEGESGLSSDDEESDNDDGFSEGSESEDDHEPRSGSQSGAEAYEESASLSSGTNGMESSQPSVDDDDDDWLGTMSNSIGLWSTSKHDSRSHRSNTQSLNRSSSRFMSESSFHDDGFDWESLEEAPDGEEDGGYGLSGRGGSFRQKLSPHQIRAKRMSERLYIQMEYCGGNSLRDVIDKGTLWKDPDKIWTLLRQILEAIVYIHRQGIIHRDIKPPNVFLDAEGIVKLGDFGLAVRPPKIAQDDIDGGENDINHEGLPPIENVGNLLSNSTGSSAAELYGKLRMENLESTRHGFAIQKQKELTTMTTMSDANITAGVGTAFYRAPEQEKEGQRYNQKADMFSLGIMFFEMWSPPFTTLMERAQALTGLREQCVLPAAFAGPDNVKEIILWLCSPNPSSRPNAVELLASPLLPAKIEVEGTYLREALETLANPEGKFFGQLIDALISQEPVSHVDYTYDHLESIKLRSYTSELRSRTFVKTVLQKIFERHGAIEHTTPLLMPRASEQNFTGVTLTTPQSSCVLLDSSGVAVSLPFDLTERLARFVARYNISRLKCYQFDRVYRKNIVGGHPRELIESDFDIIWDDRCSFRFIELEGLEVVAEVMQALSSSLGSYFLRLNDARITRGIIELCNVPSTARRELLKLLSNEVSMHVHPGPASTMTPTLKAGRWKFVAKRMKAYGAPADSIDALKPFFMLPEDCLTSLDLIEQEVQRLFARNRSKPGTVDDSSPPSDAAPVMDRKQQQKRDAQLRRTVKDITEGISSLRVLLQSIEFLRLAGPSCLRVDLGLSPRPERYTSGFVFQAVLLSGSNSSSSVATTNTQVIAEGGRYDSLITRFKLPAAYMKSSSVAAMGVRFSVDKIVSCVMGAICSAHLDAKAFASSLATDVLSGGRKVLICSAGKASDTMLLRMKMALMLWHQGIGADYLHPEPLHLEDLEDYCAQSNIHWMVVVQKHLVKEKNQVKIRAVKNPSEADIVVTVSALAEVVGELLTGGGAGRNGGGSAGTGGSGYGDYYSMAGGRTVGGGGNFYDATNAHGGGGMGGSGGGIGGGGNGEAASLQPIFDVKVVDSRYQSRDGGGRNKNNQYDSHKVTRRVSKWIMSSFASRGEEAMKVLSVDLPFALVRELSSAIMEEGMGGLDTVSANNPRYRKQLKYTVEELMTLEPTGGRERYVLLHSLVDDRYDMMSLTPATKRKSAGGGSNRRNL